MGKVSAIDRLHADTLAMISECADTISESKPELRGNTQRLLLLICASAYIDGWVDRRDERYPLAERDK